MWASQESWEYSIFHKKETQISTESNLSKSGIQPLSYLHEIKKPSLMVQYIYNWGLGLPHFKCKECKAPRYHNNSFNYKKNRASKEEEIAHLCMLLKTPESKAFRLGKYYKLSGKYSIYTVESPAQSSVITWTF